jgi:hypothetical protein
VWAALGVNATLCQAQALDGPVAHQVLPHNFRGVRRLDVSVPHGLRVNHDGGAVLTLVQAEGFVDAHRGAKSSGLRELLQLRVEFAFAIRGAGWAGRIGGAGVVADKDMTFKRGQAVFLLAPTMDAANSRVTGEPVPD